MPTSHVSRCPRLLVALTTILFWIETTSGVHAALEYSNAPHAVSPAGNAVACISEDSSSEIHVINLGSGDIEVLPTTEEIRLHCVAYSPDALIIAAGTADGRVFVWDMATAQSIADLKHPEHTCAVTRIVVAPGADRIAAYYDEVREVAVWSLAESKPLVSGAAFDKGVFDMWFTQDGGTFVCASVSGMWTHAGEEERGQLLEERNRIQLVSRSADGTLAATRSLMGFQVWNLLGDPTSEKLDYEKPLQVLFTRGGERLLIVRPDENNDQRYALDLWDISEGLQQATFFHSIEKLGVPRVAISSDQHRIAAVHDRSRNDFELRITNLADLTEELEFGRNYSFDDRNLGQITDLQFSPDGMSLLTLWRDGLVTHWDLSASRNVVHFDDRTSVTTIQEPYPMIVAAAMTDVPLDRLQIAADGDAIIGGGPTAELVIWRKSDDLRAVTPQVFAFQDGNARYRSIEECDVAPEAKQIAAIVDYNGAVLIDIPSGNPVYLSRDAFLVRFNQRGTKLHLSGSSTTLMYDLQAGRSFPLSRRPSATAQSFQERLTSGVSFENDSWGLIDPDSGAAVASLVPENIRSSGQWAISPDKTLFAALARGRNSDGYGIEVFDIKSAKRTVYMPINLDSWNRLRFSPDGSKLLISTSDSILTVDYRRRKIVDTIWPYGKGSTETPERSIAGSSAGGAAKVAAASQVACGSWRGGPVSCMDVTATGMLAVGAKGGDVTLLSLDSKRNPYTHKLPGREVNDVRFSDNGKLLTCQTEYDLFLVDVSEFAVLDAEAEPHDGAQDEEPGDTFAERQAAKVKVAKSLSALLDDDNEFVRQLAQELLRRLDSAASQAGDSSSESQ